MKIKHSPIFDTQFVLEYYKSEGVKYVCTTELKIYGVLNDVFYRPTPHPVYGNRYFGLYKDSFGTVYICNADCVENLQFGMIDNGKDEWTYSRYTHDFLSWGSAFIDGGRSYTRVGGKEIPKVKYFKVKDGEFVEVDNV